MPRPRQRKYTEVETFFGKRMVVWVKLPIEWNGIAVIEQMDWAKWWEVVSLYDGFLIKCGVKKHYLKYFVHENKQYIQWHRYYPEGVMGEEPQWELDHSLYD